MYAIRSYYVRHIHANRIVYAIGVLVLMAGSFALGMVQTPQGVANAQTAASSPLDPLGSQTGTHTCAVDSVGVFKSRIQVHCSNAAAGTITTFAFAGGGSFSAHINRFLALANSAYALGHHLDILYDDDSAGNPPGCSAAVV